MMLRAYLLVARAAFPTSHAQEETTALDLIIIKLKITVSFIFISTNNIALHTTTLWREVTDAKVLFAFTRGRWKT
jgi:hypothetical protein